MKGNKSLYIEVLSTMKVAKLSTSVTLLVNFTNSVRKADVYTKHCWIIYQSL